MKLSDLNLFKKKWVFVEYTDASKEDGHNEAWGILANVELGFLTLQEYGGMYDHTRDLITNTSDDINGLVKIPIENVNKIKIVKTNRPEKVETSTTPRPPQPLAFASLNTKRFDDIGDKLW